MEGKILIINEFAGTDQQTFKNYKFFLEGGTYWLSELDFKQHKHLFEIQEDKLILKASAEQYVVKKKSNKKGEFYVILPNIETTISSVAEPEVAYVRNPDKSVGKEEAKQEIERDENGEIILKFGMKISPKARESFKMAAKNRYDWDGLKANDEGDKSKVASSSNFQELSHKLKLDPGKFLGMLTTEEAKNMIEGTVNQIEPLPERSDTKKLVIPPKPITSTPKVINIGSESKTNEKILFIKGLLRLSQQQHTSKQTQEKLFLLIEKELGKSGGVEMEILKELHEIKSKLFPHDDKNLIAGTIHSEVGLSLKKPIKKSRKGLHKPKDVADFMQLFEKRNGLKWLTHDFDNSESEFEIEIFLKQAKIIFYEFISHHYLPTSLWKITYEFAFNENPQWGEKRSFKQGWSSPTWIEWSKSEKMHPMKNNEFYEIIQGFRRQTRIESPELDRLIKNELRIVLKDEFSGWQVELIDCQKADFYTNTAFFKKALALIFDGIGKRSSISKKLIVQYIREVEGAYKKKIIKICHHDSFLTRPVEDLINEITNEEKGDFNSVKNFLYGYCDWLIETKYESDPIRITVLGEEKGVDIEFLDTKSEVEGFTHFLIFYTK